MAQLSWQRAATMLRQLHRQEYRAEFEKLLKENPLPLSRSDSEYIKKYNLLMYKATRVLTLKYHADFLRLKDEAEQDGYQTSAYSPSRRVVTVVSLEFDGRLEEEYFHKVFNEQFSNVKIKVAYRRRNQ
jgi:hypothetical protein